MSALDELERLRVAAEDPSNDANDASDKYQAALFDSARELIKIARAVADDDVTVSYRRGGEDENYLPDNTLVCALCGETWDIDGKPKHAPECVWLLARKLAGGDK